jgi:hypothetical protein
VSSLIVPVSVVALCVSERDAHEATPRFAGPLARYDQRGDADAFLLTEIAVPLAAAAESEHQLGVGVHLHWALPEALRRGETNGKLKFPAAPNRWLVTRLPGSATRSWVVCSDLLLAHPDWPGTCAIPVRVGERAEIRWLGGVIEPGQYPPRVREEDSFEALTRASLGVVSNGLPSFAAYYPGCRNVFGFHDAELPAKGEMTLTYVVTGWYAETSDRRPR